MLKGIFTLFLAMIALGGDKRRPYHDTNNSWRGGDFTGALNKHKKNFRKRRKLKRAKRGHVETMKT